MNDSDENPEAPICAEIQDVKFLNCVELLEIMLNHDRLSMPTLQSLPIHLRAQRRGVKDPAESPP